MYEYHCFECGKNEEVIRPINKRNALLGCECGHKKEMIVSMPTINIWDRTREFPNLTGRGNGAMKFNSNAEYRAYLKEHGVDEFAHDGKNYRPHGNKLIGSWK